MFKTISGFKQALIAAKSCSESPLPATKLKTKQAVRLGVGHFY